MTLFDPEDTVTILNDNNKDYEYTPTIINNILNNEQLKSFNQQLAKANNDPTTNLLDNKYFKELQWYLDDTLYDYARSIITDNKAAQMDMMYDISKDN